MKHDMTVGDPAKKLVGFAIPLILGNLFQQLYSLVDSMIVGNFVGEEALAAVGSCFAVTMLFIAVAIGASIGASVIVSQLFGAHRYQAMKKAIFTALISFLVISIVWAGFGMLIKQGLLTLLNTPENIFEDASIYLSIYFLGIPFMFMYNALSSIFNALGDSRMPLVFLIFSSAVNVVLDLWFVIRFGMGVAGVAWATLIAQVLSVFLSFAVLMWRLKRMSAGFEEEVIVENDDSKGLYSFPLLLTMMKVAIPSIIQQSIVSISMLAVQALVNPYGSSVVAGYAAAQKIDSVAIMPMQAVGNAMSTFTAQNIGANKHERVREGYRASYSLIFLINVLIWSLIRFEAEPLLSLFLEAGSGSVAMKTGLDYLHLVSMTYFLLGLLMVTGSVLRGAGDLKWFMINSVINVVARIVCAYGLNSVLGVASVWISVPIGWFCGYACHFYRYRQRKWMEKHLI